jgi:MFS family permease
MFFVSDWYYAYIFNDVNGVRFNTRTRALNNTLYYAMQIVGAFLFGYALDRAWVRRTIRARIVWAVLLALTMVIWGFSYAFQKKYTRMEVTAKNYQTLDWKDSGYIGPMFLYMFYGFFDAAWQISVYW